MNIMVFGDGVMGNIVRQMILEGEDTLAEYGTSDALIDFSYPGNIDYIYEYAYGQYEMGNPIPAVIATTGYSEEQTAVIRKIAEFSPVMLSANYSFGMNCMIKLVEKALTIAGKDADIEIIEKHHNRKVDVPSGTALNLAKLTGRSVLCGRSANGKRGKEVCVHSVRGGNIFGEHSVILAIDDEIIEIKHTAYSRRIFARGAVQAAHWLKGKPAGIYNPLDCIRGLC